MDIDPVVELIGTQDKVIPPAQQLAMAAHAGSHVMKIKGSHLSMISHPKAVTQVIVCAADATS